MYRKKRTRKITVEFEDDTIEEYEVNALFRQSENYRTKDRVPIERWDEFHISWYTMQEQKKKPRPVEDVYLPDEISLVAEELKKDPQFAGIADGRAHYYQKPNGLWNEFDQYV